MFDIQPSSTIQIINKEDRPSNPNMSTKIIAILSLSLIIIQINVANGQSTTPKWHEDEFTPKELVCFLHSWNAGRQGMAKFTPLNINPYMCTQIVYANADIDGEHGIRAQNPEIDIEKNGFRLFTGLKKHNPKLKTILGIGGAFAGSARFSALAYDQKRRKSFAQLATQFLREYDFDGINLNWQVPTLFEKSRPTDKENYVLLAKDLREEFENEAKLSKKPRLIITMSIPGVTDYIEKGFNIPKLTPVLDWIYLLTYDFHTPFETFVSHHTPLYFIPGYDDRTLNRQLTVNYTINYLLRIGADHRKLIMGLPAYGRTYTLFNSEETDLGSPADGPGERAEYTLEKGFIAFFEICSSIKRSLGWSIQHLNKDAMGPYAYQGNQWISYDDFDIIKLKTQFALNYGLGGVLFMSMDMDDFRGICYNRSYPLIQTAKDMIIAYELNALRGMKSETEMMKMQNMMVTTPEPPTTPSPEEHKIFTRNEVDEYVKVKLEEKQMETNKSRKLTDNPLFVLVGSPEDLNQLLENADTIRPTDDSSSPFQLKLPLSRPDQLQSQLPILTPSVIGKRLTSVNDNQNDWKSVKDRRLDISNLHSYLQLLNPLYLSDQESLLSAPRSTLKKSHPPTLNNAKQPHTGKSDDKVKLKITYEGDNQEIQVAIK